MVIFIRNGKSTMKFNKQNGLEQSKNEKSSTLVRNVHTRLTTIIIPIIRVAV